MQKNTQRLIIIALLICLEIILTRFLSITTPIVRIGFGFLPIAVAGILYGPLWAGVAYACGDILGMFIFPSGPYFPGFTLTAFLTGATYGLLLHRISISWSRIILAVCLVCIVFNLGLDTLWLKILQGDAYLALLPYRAIKCVIMIPVQVFLIKFFWETVKRLGLTIETMKK